MSVFQVIPAGRGCRTPFTEWVKYLSTNDAGKFVCRECKTAEFTARQSLYEHVRVEHMGLRYFCPLCPSCFFKSRSAVHRHIQATHPGENLLPEQRIASVEQQKTEDFSLNDFNDENLPEDGDSVGIQQNDEETDGMRNYLSAKAILDTDFHLNNDIFPPDDDDCEFQDSPALNEEPATILQNRNLYFNNNEKQKNFTESPANDEEFQNLEEFVDDSSTAIVDPNQSNNSVIQMGNFSAIPWSKYMKKNAEGQECKICGEVCH